MRYIWADGAWRNPHTLEPMESPSRDQPCMPMVQSDIEAYKSPVGNYWVDGRRAQREDLKRNDCVINEKPRIRRDPEEYAHRKAKQAKYLEKRKAGLI